MSHQRHMTSEKASVLNKRDLTSLIIDSSPSHTSEFPKTDIDITNKCYF